MSQLEEDDAARGDADDGSIQRYPAEFDQADYFHLRHVAVATHDATSYERFFALVVGMEKAPITEELSKTGIRWVQASLPEDAKDENPYKRFKFHCVPHQRPDERSLTWQDAIQHFIKRRQSMGKWVESMDNHACIGMHSMTDMVKNLVLQDDLAEQDPKWEKLKSCYIDTNGAIHFFGPVKRKDKIFQIYVELPDGHIVEIQAPNYDTEKADMEKDCPQLKGKLPSWITWEEARPDFFSKEAPQEDPARTKEELKSALRDALDQLDKSQQASSLKQLGYDICGIAADVFRNSYGDEKHDDISDENSDAKRDDKIQAEFGNTYRLLTAEEASRAEHSHQSWTEPPQGHRRVHRWSLELRLRDLRNAHHIEKVVYKLPCQWFRDDLPDLTSTEYPFRLTRVSFARPHVVALVYLRGIESPAELTHVVDFRDSFSRVALNNSVPAKRRRISGEPHQWSDREMRTRVFHTFANCGCCE